MREPNKSVPYPQKSTEIPSKKENKESKMKIAVQHEAIAFFLHEHICILVWKLDTCGRIPKPKKPIATTTAYPFSIQV
jgi:hypothetical protein